MSEKFTLARPYAEAAFRLAQERKALKEWSSMLRLAAQIVADPAVSSVIQNPRVAAERVMHLLLDIGGERFNKEGANFLRVVHGNDRLEVMPEIAAQFDELKAEAEGSIEAEVTAAFALQPDQLQGIAQALKKKLGREVTIKSKVDESLMGGAIIRAGDLVIDGSVHGQLRALTSHLNR